MLPPEAMGIDPTISVTSKAEDYLARGALHEHLDDTVMRAPLKITVPDTEGNGCEVIVGPPVTQPRSVVGRSRQGPYENCRLLHRDFSGGNTLILPNGEGMLNDWALAIHVDGPEKDPRQVTRTGTWRYISTMLLENPLKANDLQEDLESLVHVVM
ncbi:hypothetical protein ARMSODRAFT_1007552 [Armillaria solidipes]|uniref:Protein kinase domain-containing protein n=1 Tax=Armillaria solidipes TaxID=1076256 RepID=A0A2H3B9X1_9AGAR|nr:hypothetical protein ARMSODRAFT_1007552 [Armillaria solidipes]